MYRLKTLGLRQQPSGNPVQTVSLADICLTVLTTCQEVQNPVAGGSWDAKVCVLLDHLAHVGARLCARGCCGSSEVCDRLDCGYSCSLQVLVSEPFLLL